jgi:hypothetical protein
METGETSLTSLVSTSALRSPGAVCCSFGYELSKEKEKFLVVASSKAWSSSLR